MKKPQVSHKGRVVQIEKEEGTYSILYGMHVKSQAPEDLPENVDGVILETGTTQYLSDPLGAIDSLSKHVQYKEFIKQLEEKRIPLYFVDVKYKFNDYALLFADNGIAAAEWFVGRQLMEGKGKKQEKGIASLIVSSWLLLPFVANAVRLVSVLSNVGLKQSAALKKFSHRLHPEVDFIYLTLRNAIIAEKERFIMSLLGGKKHLSSVLGAGHVGIEEMLQMSDEKRLANIKSLMPVIKKIAMPDYLYKAVEYVYNGRNWEVSRVITIPTLQAFL